MQSILDKLPGRRRILIVLGVIIILWVFFLDSHSVLNRVRWHREADRLREENARMEAVIEQTKDALSRRDDEKEIERVARESYGMRREGETVYRVDEQGE